MDLSPFKTELLIAVITVILSGIISFLISRFSVNSERKKMVTELKRNSYMQMLEIVSRLLDNPALVYEESFLKDLKHAELHVRVYGDDGIVKETEVFSNLIKTLWKSYAERFKSDPDYEELESLRDDPFFGDMIAKEEDDFIISNLPDRGEIKSIAKSLFESIRDCLLKN